MTFQFQATASQITVSTADGRTVASYPPGDPATVLERHGWRLVEGEVGPADWAMILRTATHARDTMQLRANLCRDAWFTCVVEAMNDEHTVKRDIAMAAGVSERQAWEICRKRR